MSLAIVLTVNGEAPEYDEENSISFSGDAADYWYLWPTMIKEVQKQTGELIDLYDDAEFEGENLEKLEKIILTQLAQLKGKKELLWDVRTGTQLQPVKKEILVKLLKKDIENKLEKFLMIVRKAKHTNEKVFCLGD